MEAVGVVVLLFEGEDGGGGHRGCHEQGQGAAVGSYHRLGQGHGGGSQPLGRMNYSANEFDHLFESVRLYPLMLGLEQYQRAHHHVLFHSDQDFTGERLKKFEKLARTKNST